MAEVINLNIVVTESPQYFPYIGIVFYIDVSTFSSVLVKIGRMVEKWLQFPEIKYGGSHNLEFVSYSNAYVMNVFFIMDNIKPILPKVGRIDKNGSDLLAFKMADATIWYFVTTASPMRYMVSIH